MAYYQFDFTFTNLAALPAGSTFFAATVIFSGLEQSVTESVDAPFPSSHAFTLDSSDSSERPAFELDSSWSMWVELEAVRIDGGSFLTDTLHTLGPYTVGDVGTEVPPP